MKIQIKQHLLQEGVMQMVKDNWGKGLMAAGAVAAANAGVFGAKAEQAVQNGGTAMKGFLDTATKFGSDGMQKMANKYGVDVDNDGKKDIVPTTDDHDPMKPPLDSNDQSVVPSNPMDDLNNEDTIKDMLTGRA